MKRYSLEELAEIINADYNRQGGFVSSVSTDSRNIKPGDCFFAIEGENFDGHDFVAQAMQKGAACAVINKWFPISDEYRSFILGVDDPVEALGRLAAHYRRDCNFKVIAITGSVGKTTTRHIIAHVLKSHYKVFQAPKNFNNQIGLPLTLLNADEDTEIIVAELGANHPGEIAHLSDIAAPDIAVVTNVYPSHLEGFGSIDKIIEEKLSIAKGLKPDGKFLISGDYENLLNTAKKQNHSFETFGLSQTCIIKPDTFSILQTQSKFQIDNVSVAVPIAGKGNLENAVTAWAVCKQFGISAERFASVIENLAPIPMRAEIKQFGTLTVIDDCYNANPGSMKNALEILSSVARQKQGRAVFVCGDMLELGDWEVDLHNELGCAIVNARVKLLLTAGRLTRITSDRIKSMAYSDIDVYDFQNSEQVCNNLHKFIKVHDIVLVKGSRSIGLEKVVDKLKQIFDKILIETEKN
ncbi:MAG: UDP-N-acetylmuramoyl-tripeptide--D-alanyl-D-alanine ligase [Sedimentisphaerales bacterium]|nr:UDP-N-acetylmuramoyl-tripeptide--D-alanyl-D-alanine ligase [Sedimentisphaerales bacterium]